VFKRKRRGKKAQVLARSERKGDGEKKEYNTKFQIAAEPV
jgi:hypothetical protein